MIRFRPGRVLVALAAACLTAYAQDMRRSPLSLGSLYLPADPETGASAPLFLFFHGAKAPVEAARQLGSPVLSVHIDGTSEPYGAAFSRPGALRDLVAEAERKSGMTFGPLILGCFSAGCGAVRAILRDEDAYERVQAVMALDGIYADYQGRRPSKEQMEVWLRLARDASEGRKQFVVTHTEANPPAYASTGETADWLLEQLGLKRSVVGRAAPRTEAGIGSFLVQGFAGVDGSAHFGQLKLITSFLKDLWPSD